MQVSSPTWSESAPPAGDSLSLAKVSVGEPVLLLEESGQAVKSVVDRSNDARSVGGDRGALGVDGVQRGLDGLRFGGGKGLSLQHEQSLHVHLEVLEGGGAAGVLVLAEFEGLDVGLDLFDFLLEVLLGGLQLGFLPQAGLLSDEGYEASLRLDGRDSVLDRLSQLLSLVLAELVAYSRHTDGGSSRRGDLVVEAIFEGVEGVAEELNESVFALRSLPEGSGLLEHSFLLVNELVVSISDDRRQCRDVGGAVNFVRVGGNASPFRERQGGLNLVVGDFLVVLLRGIDAGLLEEVGDVASLVVFGAEETDLSVILVVHAAAIAAARVLLLAILLGLVDIGVNLLANLGERGGLGLGLSGHALHEVHVELDILDGLGSESRGDEGGGDKRLVHVCLC